MTYGNGEVAPYFQVNSSEDSRIHEALRFVYNYHVHYMPGDSIVALEQTVYFVESKTLQVSPEWSAQLTVFSVWDQERQILNFRLRKEDTAA